VCVCVSADDVAFYEYYVPEGERHESALKRNRESLVAELKLWDGYLEKVVFLKSSRLYFYSALYNTDCLEAEAQ